MPRIVRIALIVFGGILATVVTGLAVLLWAVGIHTPDLTPTQAERIISNTPEFNQSRSLIRVLRVRREAESLKDCCYEAEFVFAPITSGKNVAANAEFRYWNRAWHLQEFFYGEPPAVETVWIRSDVPKGKSF